MLYKILLVGVVILFILLALFGSRLDIPPWAITGLLLLICPVSMAFMHGGHDHGRKTDDASKNKPHDNHRM